MSILKKLNGLVETMGHQFWYQNDQLHRENDPAVIMSDGALAWYQNGQRHRLDGPAVIMSDGALAWYQNGQRHRLDGPAVVLKNGVSSYYIHDKKLGYKDWLKQRQPYLIQENLKSIL